MQIEAANLRGRNVDVIGACHIARLGRAQKAESVGKNFKRAVAVDGFAELGLLLQNGVHKLLLAHALSVVDFERSGHV